MLFALIYCFFLRKLLKFQKMSNWNELSSIAGKWKFCRIYWPWILIEQTFLYTVVYRTFLYNPTNLKVPKKAPCSVLSITKFPDMTNLFNPVPIHIYCLHLRIFLPWLSSHGVSQGHVFKINWRSTVPVIDQHFEIYLNAACPYKVTFYWKKNILNNFTATDGTKPLSEPLKKCVLIFAAKSSRVIKLNWVLFDIVRKHFTRDTLHEPQVAEGWVYIPSL